MHTQQWSLHTNGSLALLCRPSHSACRAQAERAREAEAAASAEVARLEGLLREVRGRVEQRRGEITSQQAQGSVVKALLQARDRGEIEGIHGRLGESEGRS